MKNSKKPLYDILNQDEIPIVEGAGDEYFYPYAPAWIDPEKKISREHFTPDVVTAVYLGDIEGLEEILNENPEAVHTTDYHGKTLFSWAEQPEVIQVLLNHGANANGTERKEKPALFWANKECAEVLIAHPSVDVNAVDSEGNNALHKTFCPEIIKILVDAGTDINALNHEGKTPLDTRGQCYFANILVENGAKTSAELKNEQSQAPTDMSNDTSQIAGSSDKERGGPAG